MRKLTLPIVFLLALVPAIALAQTAIGTLHHSGAAITFSFDGRALVIKQRGPGSKTDEYQILRCEVLASKASHVLTLRSMGADFDHIPSPGGASMEESSQSVKSMSWPFPSKDDRAASAIVKAIQNRPASCQ